MVETSVKRSDGSEITCSWSKWPGVEENAPVIMYVHGGGFTAGCSEVGCCSDSPLVTPFL